MRRNNRADRQQRDSSHVKGKMEQHIGAGDFNILLATDSYKVSREPQPGPNRAGPGELIYTGEPVRERNMREYEGGFILQAVNG